MDEQKRIGYVGRQERRQRFMISSRGLSKLLGEMKPALLARAPLDAVRESGEFVASEKDYYWVDGLFVLIQECTSSADRGTVHMPNHYSASVDLFGQGSDVKRSYLQVGTGHGNTPEEAFDRMLCDLRERRTLNPLLEEMRAYEDMEDS